MWIDVEVVCYDGVSCSLAQNWDNLWGKEKFCGWLRFRLCLKFDGKASCKGVFQTVTCRGQEGAIINVVTIVK